MPAAPARPAPALLPAIAALVLALAAVVVLWQYWVPVPAGQDQSCYFAMARLLDETGTTHYAAFVDGETTGSFWVNDGHDAIWPVYAPGYPLLLAAARRLAGPGAEYWVTPLAFFLLILATYALARRFLPAWWALLATFFFAVSPALFLNAQLMNTHVVGCLLTVVSLLLATARGGHPRPIAAALCGLLLSCGAAVRYPEALLLLAPPALWLTARGRRPPSAPRPSARRARLPLLLAYAAGAALPLAALAWYHTAAFGAPWRTGYAFFNAAANGFSWRYLPRTLLVYLPGLVTCGFGPACALFLLWLAPGGGKKQRGGRPAFPAPLEPMAGRAFWLAWLLPLPVLYHFYFWIAPESMHLTMRFWLSVFPGFAILGVCALRRLLKHHFWGVGGMSRRARWAVGALIAAQGAWAVQFTTPAAENNALYAAMAARQAGFLGASVPDGAWVIFHHAAEEKDRDVFAEALFGVNHCHLFSSQLFTPGAFLQNAVADLAARAEGAPNTQQDDRARARVARTPEKWRAGFLARLWAAASAGTPLYYYGNLQNVPGFMEAHRGLFAYGEPIFGDFIVPACVMFPQKRRQHNSDDRPVNVYPPLALVPLIPKALAPTEAGAAAKAPPRQTLP